MFERLPAASLWNDTFLEWDISLNTENTPFRENIAFYFQFHSPPL